MLENSECSMARIGRGCTNKRVRYYCKIHNISTVLFLERKYSLPATKTSTNDSNWVAVQPDGHSQVVDDSTDLVDNLLSFRIVCTSDCVAALNFTNVALGAHGEGGDGGDDSEEGGELHGALSC